MYSAVSVPRMRYILMTGGACLVTTCPVSVSTHLSVYLSKDPLSVKSTSHWTPRALIWPESSEQEETGSVSVSVTWKLLLLLFHLS